MTQFIAGMAKIQRELGKAHAPGGRTMAKALTTQPAAASGVTMSSEQFMAKALSENRAGRLSTAEVSEIESAIAHGRQPRAELVKAVVPKSPKSRAPSLTAASRGRSS